MGGGFSVAKDSFVWEGGWGEERSSIYVNSMPILPFSMSGFLAKLKG